MNINDKLGKLKCLLGFHRWKALKTHYFFPFADKCTRCNLVRAHAGMGYIYGYDDGDLKTKKQHGKY